MCQYLRQEFRRYSRKDMVRGKGWTSNLVLLKRDLFVQGLSLKWQEKVLPSAVTFADAFHQARAAEEQDTLLGELHLGRPPDKPPGKQPPSRSSSQNQSIGEGELERTPGLRTSDTWRGVRPQRYYICHSLQH